MGRKPDNPVKRLDQKEKAFLGRYILGEAPFMVASELWPEAEQGPVFHVINLMHDKRFEDALEFVTDPLLSPRALAMRQLAIADHSKEARDKVSAIRGAICALTGQIPIRRHNKPGDRIGKTQKVKVPPMPKDELRDKMLELAEKATQFGSVKPS